MLFDLLMIAIIVAIFIFSCCGLLTKLRHHEEARRAMQAQQPIGVAVVNSSGIFPSSCGPPPYPEYDLPPKYEEVIKNNKDYPTIHKSSSLEKVLTQP